MEWMIDTADLSAVRSAFDTLPVAGVTTNPSILKKEMTMGYYDHLSALKSLCRNASLHVQLGSNTCEGMLQEANILWNCLGRDTYLKIPVTEEGLKTILRLKKEGANITATAVYYPMQGMLAIAAGADYLAVYCNRMEQNSLDYCAVIGQLRRLIDRDSSPSRILAASFKNAGQIAKAIDAGAHAVTAPPTLILSALNAPLVTDAVRTFNRDQEAIKAR